MAIKLNPNFDKNNNPKEDENGLPISESVEKRRFSFLTILFWVSIVFIVVMGLIAIAPLAAIFLFLLVGIFWLIIVVFPTIFTIGLIWTSSKYRGLVEWLNNGLSGVFDEGGTVSSILDFINQAYWYVLYIGAPIILIGLIWSIVDYKTEGTVNRLKKRRMFDFIAFVFIFTVAAIVAGIFAVSSQ